MDLDKLRIFYFAAEAGSFTNSGLNLSPSAVSRHVSDLEHRMKRKLFHRHPKGLVLTAGGEVLYKSLQKVFSELEFANAKLDDMNEEPQGPLKVTTPNGWPATFLVQNLAPFLKKYPKIRMSVISTDYVTNISKHETDVTIIPHKPTHPDAIGVKLTTMHLGLFASQSYLDANGTPKTVEDLDNHQLITYGDHQHPLLNINWLLEIGRDSSPREAYLKVNNLYYAAAEGLGITTLALENSLLKTGQLVRVLPQLEEPTIDVYFVYHQHLKTSKRIQAFKEYMLALAKEQSVRKA